MSSVYARTLLNIAAIIRHYDREYCSVLSVISLRRSRDDSVENLFEDDEMVGDLPTEEGIREFQLAASCFQNYLAY